MVETKETTYAVWGYRGAEAKVFNLRRDEQLPDGWHGHQGKQHHPNSRHLPHPEHQPQPPPEELPQVNTVCADEHIKFVTADEGPVAIARVPAPKRK
jgi:hypothetical protein